MCVAAAQLGEQPERREEVVARAQRAVRGDEVVVVSELDTHQLAQLVGARLGDGRPLGVSFGAMRS